MHYLNTILFNLKIMYYLHTLLFKLRLIGIGGFLFNAFKEFLTNQKQHVTGKMVSLANLGQ